MAQNSCDTLLNDLFSWADQQDLTGGKAVVDCALVSNQSDGTVSYASGVLEFSPPRVLVDVIEQPAQFSGELLRFFSNGAGSNTTPFAAQNRDAIRLTISEGGGPIVHPSPRRLTITLVNRANSSFGFEPQCLADVIYSVGNPIGSAVSQALYVVSLSNRRYIANS